MPNLSDTESANSHMHTKDMRPTIQPYKRHKTRNAADSTIDTHSMDTANHRDTADRLSPLVKSTDTPVDADSKSANVCMPVDLDVGVDTAVIVNPAGMSSQSADANAGTEAVAMDSTTKPLPPSTCRTWRCVRCPTRYLDNVQVSSSLTG